MLGPPQHVAGADRLHEQPALAAHVLADAGERIALHLRLLRRPTSSTGRQRPELNAYSGGAIDEPHDDACAYSGSV